MPRILKSGEREMVLKVKSFCEREKLNKKPIIPLELVRLRVATMTGISEKTVTKIRKEGEVAAQTSTKKTEDGVFTSDSKGPRWIIVHAGGEMGFIPNAQLIFKSQSKSGDYHDDMNRVNFIKWLQDLLSPNLPPQSIVVMDNASYHTVAINKAPTMSSTKTEMQNWIVNKGLAYLPSMMKAQLFEIIQEHKEPAVYEVDCILEEHGHTVLRLPPYHCDLNPIELL